MSILRTKEASAALDGSNYNREHDTWGTPKQPIQFVTSKPDYGDGVESPAGELRASARQISNDLFTGHFAFNVRADVSSWIPYYGQFLAHDMISASASNERFDIPVPMCDPFFDRFCTGNAVLNFTRHGGTIDPDLGYRQAGNDATSWIDASVVYGCSETRLAELRTFVGGRMKTSKGPHGDLLPFNRDQLDNAGGPDVNLFVAGDSRSNINLPLLCLQTLFVLEHNRRADVLHLKHPSWPDEVVFQNARRYVIALHQKIAYREYLPKLLGQGLPPYQGFNSSVNPAVDAGFMSAAFRYGHSATNELVLLLDESRRPEPRGHLSVGTTILNPSEIRDFGLDSILRGLVMLPEADSSIQMVPGMRSSTILFDMAAVDIQRGRDRGVTSYNNLRRSFGLTPATSFAAFTNRSEIQRLMSKLYNDSVELVDAYVGGLSERAEGGGLMGPLYTRMIIEQFTRLRDADRFYYLNPGVLTDEELQEISGRTLSNLIIAHTNIKSMPDDVFALQQFAGGGYLGGDTSGWNVVVYPISGMRASWKTTNGIWSVELVTNKGGWVAIGFGKMMGNADVIWGMSDPKNSTNVIVQDCFVNLPVEVKPTPDVEIGGSDDIIPGSVSGTQIDGVLTVRFSRLLVTPDNDFDIAVDLVNAQSLIFAHGSTPTPEQHGQGRAQLDLMMFQKEVSPVVVIMYTATSMEQQVAVSLTIFGCLITVIFWVLLYRNRTEPTLKAGSISFLHAILGLATMIMALLYTIILDSTTTVCSVRIALFGILFMTSLTIIAVKNYRIYKIFNTKVSQAHRVATSDRALLKQVAIVVLPGVLLIIAQLGLAPPTIELLEVSRTSNLVVNAFSCHYNPVWKILLYSYIGVIVAGGIAVSVASWSIPDQFNEARHLCLAQNVITFTCIIIVPVIELFQDQMTGSHLLTMGAIFFTTLGTICWIMVPKLFAARSGSFNQPPEITQKGVSTAIARGSCAAASSSCSPRFLKF